MSVVHILNHMNNDHRVSLHDYLEYYGGVHIDANSTTDKVELTDVKLNEITIAYTKGGAAREVVIPLHPPMSKLSEARVRFVRMAFEAATALHVSPYQITDFVWPRTFSLALQFLGLGAGVVVTGVLGFSERAAARLPTAKAKRRFRTIFLVTLAIHILEYVHSALPLLRKFRVPPAVKRKYLLATLLTGYPGWIPLRDEALRLDAKQQSD